MESLIAWFSDARFMPHGHCYLWLPELLWMNVISDALIAGAYLTIPVTLIYFIRRRRDLPFNWVFGAFGVFILACGSTHALEILTIWQPAYWLLGGVKVVTAIASVVTAVLLVKLVPAALRIPSQAELARVNAELQHANTELRQAQRELVASARRAGMAEIATNVLHNVGNVLNSVNVSASQVIRMLRESEVGGLKQAVQLMDQHGADMAAFMGDDPRGKQLPLFLGHLADALEAERTQMQDELARLSRSIDHIKDIVTTQQAYAGGGARLVEPVDIAELVEDVLRMNVATLTRHHVEIVRQFDAVPVVPLDKHRVLMILINLIGNAKQALSGITGRALQIRISVHVTEGQHVQIGVTDNGVGIAPENLTRIFVHGFTTRHGGHGFGLHSCALAAREMGGALQVHSGGAGQGATFTLELPLPAARPA